MAPTRFRRIACAPVIGTPRSETTRMLRHSLAERSPVENSFAERAVAPAQNEEGNQGRTQDGGRPAR